MLGNNNSIYRAQVINVVIQVKLFVMFSTDDGAMYVAYVKNTGNNAIINTVFAVTSQQPMKPYDNSWTVKHHVATCDIDGLQPGQERVASIFILGNSSSALLDTTTNPPLTDPSSGMAQASYSQPFNTVKIITVEHMLNYARKLI